MLNRIQGDVFSRISTRKTSGALCAVNSQEYQNFLAYAAKQPDDPTSPDCEMNED